MEVVLQWLDDLDDLVFAWFLVWDRLRRYCLWVGLTASLTVHAAESWRLPSEQVYMLLSLSISSVLLWSVVSLIGLKLDRRAYRLLGPA